MVKSHGEETLDVAVEMLVFTTIVILMLAIAWANYSLKVSRMERENTFLYKIYYDIIMANQHLE